ncbi:MAG: hydrogen peroxide-inducible genes activator [Bacteroidales bacterium]
MTIQQLEYIIAVDKHRHFVRAANECGVTQSTLSAMIQKLEHELDIKIFNRNAHPVETTPMGQKIIKQAKILIFNAAQLQEIAQSERDLELGDLSLGIIPTIAPYIVPKLIKYIHEKYPLINLRIVEAPTASLTTMIESTEIDMALLATPLNIENILEIPIYYEKFVAYISPSSPLHQRDEISPSEFTEKNMWILHEGHCWRNQVLNLCEYKSDIPTIYEAGSIDTLIQIIDTNGGYTIIPELHLNRLTDEQLKNVRKIISNEPVREVSLIIREDYLRERLLNIVSECIQQTVPNEMIDTRLKKFRIKL